ncbi:unnamed protein product, partial [Hapterophycus canaliculatus]
VAVPAFPGDDGGGGGWEREALRREIKNAACRLLPSWDLRSHGGERAKKMLGSSFPAAVSRLLRGAPAPKPTPTSSPLLHGRRRCPPMPDGVQNALTLDANMRRRHREWDAYQAKRANADRNKRKAEGARARAGKRPAGGGVGSGGDGGGSGASERVGGDGCDRDDGVGDGDEEADGTVGLVGSRVPKRRSEAQQRATGTSAGAGAGKDKVGAREWRMPPTCYVCHLPLASVCECTASSLDVERQFWEQRVAVAAGRPLQIDLGMPEYRDDRIHGAEIKREEIAQHRRGAVTHRFRMEHSVAMQNRGLLRHPLAVLPSPSPPSPCPPPPPPPPSGASLIGEGDQQTGTPPATDASGTTTKTPAAAVTTEEERAAVDDNHDFDHYVSAAAESDEGSDLYERDEAPGVDQPERGDCTVRSESAASATAAAAAGVAVAGVSAARRKPASPMSPRLEEWRGFPSPAMAFARAAPVENPKGVLPPSPHVLRFIHQMASAKAEGTPALYGTLDESALIAVG